ncbi:hypothetical protein D3C71_2050070 [compost metagenome]
MQDLAQVNSGFRIGQPRRAASQDAGHGRQRLQASLVDVLQVFGGERVTGSGTDTQCIKDGVAFAIGLSGLWDGPVFYTLIIERHVLFLGQGGC